MHFSVLVRNNLKTLKRHFNNVVFFSQMSVFCIHFADLVPNKLKTLFFLFYI